MMVLLWGKVVIDMFGHRSLLLLVWMQNDTLSEVEMQTVNFNFMGFFSHVEGMAKLQGVLHKY